MRHKRAPYVDNVVFDAYLLRCYVDMLGSLEDPCHVVCDYGSFIADLNDFNVLTEIWSAV